MKSFLCNYFLEVTGHFNKSGNKRGAPQVSSRLMSHALDFSVNISETKLSAYRKLNPEFPSISCIRQYRSEFEDSSGFQINNAIFQAIVYAERRKLPNHQHAG